VAVLLALLCLFFACPQTMSAGSLLSYEAPDSKAQVQAILYFRYLDSPYLSPEIRSITVPHTESLEMALVKELIAGPSGGTELLSGLFPRGTEVLNVLEEGGRLFVTFSKQVENPLEKENGFSKAAREEAQLRRRLLMASLVNTLTEYGAFQDVQVLILKDPGQHSSMRLSEAFYLEDSDHLPGPLTRQEERIITPGSALAQILALWEQQNWAALMKVVALRGDEGSTMKLADFQQLPALMDISLTAGSVAPDGSSAVVLLEGGLQKQDGTQAYLKAFPVLLLRSHQGWLLSLASLKAILEAAL